MEKRLQKTLPRTLKLGASCLKVFLAAALLVPGFYTLGNVSSEAEYPEYRRWAQAGKSRPKELIHIYSIVKSNRPEIGESEVWRISDAILGESVKRKLDPLLILALIEVESGFQPAVVSPVGARGMMQILPDTGRALLREAGLEREFEESPFRPEHLDDPVLNIKLGVYYLQHLKKRFRNVMLALAAYNYGPSEISNRLENDVYFSADFATTVLSAYQRYKTTRPPTF